MTFSSLALIDFISFLILKRRRIIIGIINIDMMKIAKEKKSIRLVLQSGLDWFDVIFCDGTSFDTFDLIDSIAIET